MAESEAPWPFGGGDGGPDSRPIVVKLDGVLVAILDDDDAGERARATLAEHGVSDGHLRLYTSRQILAYDEAFRANRTVAGRVAGALVDDGESMKRYVEYGREGCCALWVYVPIREDANGVVRRLADGSVRFIWYHDRGRVETIPMT